MKIEKYSAEFDLYCQTMYTENCLERIDYGQKPYKNLNIYLTKNYDFIVDRFERGKRPWAM